MSLGNLHHKFGYDRPAIKNESVKEENSVEIGIDDIFDPLGDGNISDLDNQGTPKKIVPLIVPLHKVRNLPKYISETEVDDTKGNVFDDIKKQLKKENNQGTLEDGHLGQSDSGENDNVFIKAENLEAGEQLVLNFNKNVDKTTALRISDSQHSDKTYRREKDSEEINWADAYRTIESGSGPLVMKKLEKIIKINAPVTAAVVELHEFTCLGPDENICNHCQQIFGNLKYLRTHIRNIHRNVTDMYRCPYCPLKKKRKKTIRDHIISHHTNENDIKWFECHTCGMKFKLKWILTNHIYTHLNRAQLRDYMKQCTMCSKSFKTRPGLNSHIKYVHKKMPRRSQCQHCEYSSRHIYNVRKHIEVCHTTPDQRLTYECEKCDYKTTFEYKFKKHKKTHKDQPYCCEKCAYVAPSVQRFKLHVVTHQTTIDEKTLRYRCDKCDYRTYRTYSLSVHKLNHLKPDEIKYFCCYHCNFKAKRKDNLKTHVLKHFKNEEVVFQCFKCDFSTKKRTLLSNHLRRKHSKVKIQPKDS